MRPAGSRAARLLVVVLALAACCSCVPAGGGRGAYRVSVAIPDADRSLLRQLSLADPLAKPATAPPLASPLAAAPPFLASLATDDGRRAEDCLTAAVYYEARSEPLDGQRAVAQVVLNRVRDRAFPASVCGVVYQRSAAGCQFTFACDGSTAHPLEPRAWALAREVAEAALGGSVFAPVGAATHYHTSAILPWWAPSLARIGEVGSHIFYRWKAGLAQALTFRQAYAGREGGTAVAAGDDAAVRVVRGGDPSDASGVTVHRGGPAVEAGEATPGPSFGVRIHRGETGLAAAPTASAQPDDPADQSGH